MSLVKLSNCISLLCTEPALIVVYPDDVEVLAGDSLLLTCVGYGIPLPCQWKHQQEGEVSVGTLFTLGRAQSETESCATLSTQNA